VHPNDAQAARLDPPDLGKTEAWVVLAAEPGSYIYAGLKRGFNRDALAREVTRGTTELCVERIEARVGDCFFLPAGVVHALGPGLVIAEIQQSSNTTYRLYDWNRRGPNGELRELHVEQALAVIDYQRGPVRAQQPIPTENPHLERLVSCDKFVLDRLKVSERAHVGGDERCHVLAVIEGSVRLSGDPGNRPLGKGGVILLPAAAGSVELEPDGESIVLDAYLP
jgi:mannose-6-phosphate isomerase